MSRIIYGLIFCLATLNSYAWNAAGHKVVAQIAYDNLTPKAREMCYKYLRSRAHPTPNSSFVSASTWMDDIRWREVYWYDVMHYIDIPFSSDGTHIFPVESTNAVNTIKKAAAVLYSKKTTPADKKLALRMLIHITGDIHQPLHAITRVSAQHPKGDLGGNLFYLGPNPVGTNLHQYWDNGAGFFLGHYDEERVKNTARQLEHKLPCSLINKQTRAAKWAKMSYKLAIKNVYQLNPNETPGAKYQENAQLLVQKQVTYAGCRLAALINKIAQR
ncbi:S1/P1 nuclease [Fluoribacter dumoffii]|uniref:S1/P1 Nuclease n=1 Tax=Fluoribacter dumoffii TaxID=463 RepID=A0A377G9A9_9GAMM|nr:S1/P1 nuclease [Fluoribacter dumoffii]KTC90223.1 3'-nucleotidase/nuclease [Fluoribacter dumoffii NY 23]MCW8418569.1 S1/P1 nuclease [Fluoribacter dumoffii]MCW8453589.1 S1/P1 nuclease [Fluoribacter dumoffii]MCW8459193.1 S1/P1 nuclease [Fluoribacter dumoffii]MCW8482552.1 S1/P1 nuclease [Fluoribacter dumoffii]